jgi:hypothetical protein
MAMATRKSTPRMESFSMIRTGLVAILAWTCLFVVGIHAECSVNFLYPTSGLTFNYLDTVNVTYISTIANPTLYCSCGAPEKAVMS